MVAENRNPRTLMEAMRHFHPEAADAYVRSIKWPNGPCCPKCGSVNVGTIKSRNRMHQCREKGCRKQFSLTTGTIMEATHLRLDQWCAAAWMIACCRNGVSSCEIARTIGCKQQSAWHLLHRVRHLMKQENERQLFGAVEADCTMVGGMLVHISPMRRKRQHRGYRTNKETVHAVLERSTRMVRAEVIDYEAPQHVRPVVEKHVRPGSILSTDGGGAYNWSSRDYIHRWVNHAAGEYVNGVASTNACENFFNCLRRGLKGTYIAARPEHLQAYVDEQVYRYNHKRDSEWERFDGLMRLIVGKRLTYSTLTDGAMR